MRRRGVFISNKFWRVSGMFPMDSTTLKASISTIKLLQKVLGKFIASRGEGWES
jgi:hypothetical protein